MIRTARELDYVELLHDADGAKAGSRGTVVSEHEDSALIELATEANVDGEGLPKRELLDDLVTVPYSALRVLQPRRTTAH